MPACMHSGLACMRPHQTARSSTRALSRWAASQHARTHLQLACMGPHSTARSCHAAANQPPFSRHAAAMQTQPPTPSLLPHPLRRTTSGQSRRSTRCPATGPTPLASPSCPGRASRRRRRSIGMTPPGGSTPARSSAAIYRRGVIWWTGASPAGALTFLQPTTPRRGCGGAGGRRPRAVQAMRAWRAMAMAVQQLSTAARRLPATAARLPQALAAPQQPMAMAAPHQPTAAQRPRRIAVQRQAELKSLLCVPACAPSLLQLCQAEDLKRSACGVLLKTWPTPSPVPKNARRHPLQAVPSTVHHCTPHWHACAYT